MLLDDTTRMCWVKITETDREFQTVNKKGETILDLFVKNVGNQFRKSHGACILIHLRLLPAHFWVRVTAPSPSPDLWFFNYFRWLSGCQLPSILWPDPNICKPPGYPFFLVGCHAGRLLQLFSHDNGNVLVEGDFFNDSFNLRELTTTFHQCNNLIRSHNFSIGIVYHIVFRPYF